MSEKAPPSPDQLRMDEAALNRFLKDAFPHASDETRAEVILAEPGHVRARLQPDARSLRPGALVSGPTQMALVDTVAYALVLAHIGPVAMAVTSSLTIHFLRGCPLKPVFADARLLRLGRRIVAMDVRLWTETEERLVAQASVAYALP